MVIFSLLRPVVKNKSTLWASACFCSGDEPIKFRMEQGGFSQPDLVPLIGSKSKVSEVLSGKRQLSLRMIYPMLISVVFRLRRCMTTARSMGSVFMTRAGDLKNVFVY